MPSHKITMPSPKIAMRNTKIAMTVTKITMLDTKIVMPDYSTAMPALFFKFLLNKRAIPHTLPKIYANKNELGIVMFKK